MTPERRAGAAPIMPDTAPVTTVPARRSAADLGRLGSPPLLDYYAVYESARAGRHSGEPEGLLVEEFVLALDYSATGLVSAGWSRAERQWRNASTTSRLIRTDPALRSRVLPVSRDTAAEFYRQLCGEELPAEAALRATFGDVPPQSMSAPLRLSRPSPPVGFHETRLYRILLANDLDAARLATLRDAWHTSLTGDPAEPGVGVIATARRRIAGDAFSWDVRRIGLGSAWCLDVTCHLVTDQDLNVGRLLRELTIQMRALGLIPVTIDRFS